ncbi:Histone-fold [Sesbania bispinosa]|nr:Histone-fold [Sesbania bispinosa]
MFQGRYSHRVGISAPVYPVVVLEYLTIKVLEQAENIARDNKKSKIIPGHVLLAKRSDEELGKLFVGVTFAQSGVPPNINPKLLSTKTVEKANKEPKSPSKATKTPKKA